MRKPQWIAIAVTVGLLLLTYWGCPVRPPELEEGFRRGPLETTGLQSLIMEARADLTPAQLATLSTLEDRLESQTDEEQRIDILEQMAGEWFRAGRPAISGIYARQIAELTNTEEAWSIAGTTFTLCAQRTADDEKVRNFCTSQAEQAYQSAISINPDNPDTRINLALTYTDNPDPNNPMKGILLLRELADNYPDEPRVFIALGRLAIQTNQLEKAAERLSQAVALSPDDVDANCLLAQVYGQLGSDDLEREFGLRCRTLTQPAPSDAPTTEP